jgi:hypothetical protein
VREISTAMDSLTRLGLVKMNVDAAVSKTPTERQWQL